MGKEAKINMYRVAKCGYYESQARKPTFCDVGSALADLHTWITKTRPKVRETQTFTPGDDSEQMPVFCYSTFEESKHQDYVLTTWNETETADGQFAGLHADEAAGNATVDASAVPKGTIPGFPTYFWFIPDHKLMATIRFENRVNGHKGMNQYLAGYLERFARWVVVERGAKDRLTCAIKGYCDGNGGTPSTDMRPCFLSLPVRKQGEIDLIRENRHKIRKVIRKDEYAGVNLESNSVVRRCLADLGLTGAPQPLKGAKYRYEVNLTPSEKQLGEIITRWEDHRNTDWDDVGFEFTGTNDVRWLSKSIAKDVIDLDVQYKNEVVFDEESLAVELRRHRSQLISLANG